MKALQLILKRTNNCHCHGMQLSEIVVRLQGFGSGQYLWVGVGANPEIEHTQNLPPRESRAEILPPLNLLAPKFIIHCTAPVSCPTQKL